MWDAALSAVQNIFGCPCFFDLIPRSLAFLSLGVVMGLSLGAIPGLGGLVGLAILLPFTLDLDPLNAFAVMIGLISVTSTSDTIPSVLFGVPGTAASQATILDGHPMAKRGEAGRAFGAAYMASMMGGLFGAAILAVSIPVLRPIVLAFSAPEFFMMGMLGISMVAVLSGGAPLKGLVVGALGLMVGMVGMDYQVGEMRWTFGQLYLWEGVPLVPVALGIFAIPEMVDLVIRGTRIADVPKDALRGVTVGIRDAFRHWFLVLRSSAVGVWVGATPGLGGAVVDWFAYGHAVQTERGARDSFGTGDVRGVIAPESANNAKEGGALIPTLAFGVPGSASMAILLGVFLIQGISPGPDMLTKHLDITYTMVWSIAIANIFGTGLCLLLTNSLARLANVRVQLLAPLVIVVVFLAAFQAKRHYGDLLLLLSFGLLGWLMKRFGWPRPPLILGLVLSSVLENYFFISASHFGVSWLLAPHRPGHRRAHLRQPGLRAQVGPAGGGRGRTRSRGFRAAVPVPPQRAGRVHPCHLPAGPWRSGHRPRVARPGPALSPGGGPVGGGHVRGPTAPGSVPGAGGRRGPHHGPRSGARCSRPPGRPPRRRHLRLDRGPPGVHLGHGIPAERAALHVAVSRAPGTRPLVALPRLHGAGAGGSPGRVPLHPPHPLAPGCGGRPPGSLAAVAGRVTERGNGAQRRRSRETGCVKTPSQRGTDPRNRHSRENGNPGGVEWGTPLQHPSTTPGFPLSRE